MLVELPYLIMMDFFCSLNGIKAEIIIIFIIIIMNRYCTQILYVFCDIYIYMSRSIHVNNYIFLIVDLQTEISLQKFDINHNRELNCVCF